MRSRGSARDRVRQEAWRRDRLLRAPGPDGGLIGACAFRRHRHFRAGHYKPDARPYRLALDEFAQVIREEVAKWAKVIKAAGDRIE